MVPPQEPLLKVAASNLFCMLAPLLQSVFLKTAGSVALPVYQAAPEAALKI